MLNQNDLMQIRTIVKNVVVEEVQPMTREVTGLLLQVETRLDAKINALNRKLDTRIDEVLVVINEYATVTDRRLAHLEAFHA